RTFRAGRHAPRRTPRAAVRDGRRPGARARLRATRPRPRTGALAPEVPARVSSPERMIDGTTIELNGEHRAVRAGATVRELLEVGRRVAGERVAVELNRALLPRAQWDRVLAAGDRLEIVTFVGGG